MNEYALSLSEAEVSRFRLMAQAALLSERELWEAAGIVPGARVADVGCGPGAVSLELARLVGPDGQVWGVDQDPAAVATGRELAARSGLANVRFMQGEATATGLAAGAVDAVMMRHVLAHNGGREEAIVDHLATLVRPGGFVYLVDIDAEAIRVEPEVPELMELDERYRAFHAARGNDLSVGRRLGSLLEAAGLEAVKSYDRSRTVRTVPGLRSPAWAARDALVAEGLATAEDVARWGALFERLDREGAQFEIFASQHCAFGRRPS